MSFAHLCCCRTWQLEAFGEFTQVILKDYYALNNDCSTYPVSGKLAPEDLEFARIMLKRAKPLARC